MYGSTGDDVRLAEALVAKLRALYRCRTGNGDSAAGIISTSDSTAYPFYCGVTGALPGTGEASAIEKAGARGSCKIELSTPLRCT